VGLISKAPASPNPTFLKPAVKYKLFVADAFSSSQNSNSIPLDQNQVIPETSGNFQVFEQVIGTILKRTLNPGLK